MKPTCLYCTYVGLKPSKPIRRVRVHMHHDINVDVFVCETHAVLSNAELLTAFASLAAQSDTQEDSP